MIDDLCVCVCMGVSVMMFSVTCSIGVTLTLTMKCFIQTTVKLKNHNQVSLRLQLIGSQAELGAM